MNTVSIKKSRNGKGVFANKSFKPDQTIFEIKGEVLHHVKITKSSGAHQNNAFRYSENYYLSPGENIGAFLNHSCQPNCKILKKDKKLFLVAAEPIKKNSELVIDYSTITAIDDIWKMNCNCGKKECRKVISKFTRLPKALQKKYIDLKIVPKYILDINNS